MKYIGVFVICCAVIICVLSIFYERRSRQNKVKRRISMNDDEIFTKFYYDSNFKKEMVIDFWHKLAKVLHVDPSKLRPSDAINELKFSKFTVEDDTDDIAILICGEMPLKEHVPNFLDLHTIDDIVRYVITRKQKAMESTIDIDTIN